MIPDIFYVSEVYPASLVSTRVVSAATAERQGRGGGISCHQVNILSAGFYMSAQMSGADGDVLYHHNLFQYAIIC